jgi:hypothetical protein
MSVKKGRVAAVAVTVALTMVLTTALSGGVFAAELDISDPKPVKTDIREGLQEGQTNAFADGSVQGAPAPALQDDLATKGDVSANGYLTFPSFNPGGTVAVSDAANVLSMSGTKAGNTITVTFAGKNQAQFFASCDIVDSYLPTGDTTKTPPAGTVAYIPTDYQDSFGNTEGYYSYYDYYYSNDYEFYGPPFTHSGYFGKAGDISFNIYYQKWTVKDTIVSGGGIVPAPDGPYWEADMNTRYVQTFKQNLLGVIYYYEYERAKTYKTAWVKNGTAYPKMTPKRSGFKFDGWYTDWPYGSKVKVGSDKVWFGDSYYKNLYVHWKKQIKFTFNANKGKIKGKKSFSVWYLKKTPKAGTASRKSYYWLGWYNQYKSSGQTGYNFYKKGQINNFDKATVKYSAQWIKNGKGASLTSGELGAIRNAWQKGKKFIITRKAAKAAIGGGGNYVDEGTYYSIPAVMYEWDGPRNGYTRIIFAKGGYYNNDILAIAQSS